MRHTIGLSEIRTMMVGACMTQCWSWVGEDAFAVISKPDYALDYFQIQYVVKDKRVCV